ncbi:XRE family transcriptional regulator [Planomonospora corallina]|uniref:XRE family transcriptional regulator n=1 Tax=Planomonospora corallina TaxID=1806052 RepID=A0ABV8IEW3_9ACTN
MSGRQHRETELARRIRARGLATGRGSAQIAEEIHEKCGPQFGTTRIKGHRLAHGIALADVIEQVRALFERDGKPAPGIGETLLSAYESGLKRPGPEYLHYLCSVYRVEPVALGYEGPCICGHGHKMSGVVRGDLQDEKPDTSPGPRELSAPQVDGDLSVDGGEEDENVLRRTLLGLLAGGSVALDGQVLGSVENIRRRMDNTLVSATVSPAMLDQWEEAAVGFGRQYMNTPPLRLLCDVLLEFSAVRKAMERRQPVDLQERLCRMAAQLAGLSGMIMINLGDHRMARSFFRTGRMAADETGDRALRAWVTARESLVPLYYGDPREALNLAKKSGDLAGQTPCAAQAMAPVVEARALAMLSGAGKKDVVDQAKKALSRARAAFSQMTAEQKEDAAFGYTERQLYFHQGDALVRLGQAMEADLILEQALTKYGPSDWLDPTLIRLDRARCKLMEGDVEEAVSIATATIQGLGEGCRTDIVLQRANEVAKAIAAKAPDHAGLQTYQEVLRTASLAKVESPVGP